MRLGEVCDKIGSGATPRGGKQAYKTNGIPLIRSQNVLDFSFSKQGLAYIDDVQAKQLENVTVRLNDVLINITGDSVARVCMAPVDSVPARVNQHVAIVRATPKVADPAFILYSLQNLKSHLLSLASSGATRNALTKQMLENIEVNLPPLPEQIKIGRTLKALDDKIENNTAINHHLEPTSAMDISPDIRRGSKASRVV
jgi:type I restriction enzyme S subunit